MTRPSLVACPSCGKEVAARARTCPHCGGAVYRSSGPAWLVMLIVLAVVVGGVLFGVHYYMDQNQKDQRHVDCITAIPRPSDCP